MSPLHVQHNMNPSLNKSASDTFTSINNEEWDKKIAEGRDI